MSMSSHSYCSSCGAQVAPDSRFCRHCGTSLDPVPLEPAPVEPTPVEPTPVEPTLVEPDPSEEAQARAGREPPSILLKGCGIGCLAMIAAAVIIGLVAALAALAGGGFEESEPTGTPLSDSDYGGLAGRLTTLARERDWCYKRDGSLDSRDMEALMGYAQIIVDEAAGGDDYYIEEGKFTRALLARGWQSFIGPDYDRGGTEKRWRPPGCG